MELDTNGYDRQIDEVDNDGTEKTCGDTRIDKRIDTVIDLFNRFFDYTRDTFPGLMIR